MDRTCTDCGALFERKTARQGPRCLKCYRAAEKVRMTDYRRRKRAAKETVPCQTCGTLREWLGFGTVPKFCSRACHRFDVTCTVCGKAYRGASPRPGRCSVECRRAHDAERARKFQRDYREAHGIGYAHAKYPEMVRAHAKARRASQRGSVFVSPVRRLAVYERDGWVCQLCLEPVDPSVKTGRMAASLDHVVPASRGGPHTESNLRLAHVGCNAARGNREV